MKIIVIVLMIVIVDISAKHADYRPIHQFNLTDDITMMWQINWETKEVEFKFTNIFVGKYSWFYFGLSKRGQNVSLDICLFQKPSHNTLNIIAQDTHTNKEGTKFILDKDQNCDTKGIKQNIAIGFKRKFDTCDNDDIRMHEGTMCILWRRGEKGDFTFKEGDNPTFPPYSLQKDHGMHLLQILRDDLITIPERHIESITIEILKRDTIYWCKIQKLDSMFKQKHHIVQFEPIIYKANLVHHLEIFHCDTNVNDEIQVFKGDCDKLPKEAEVCSKVIYLWAMGASSFTYPIETGLPIGGEDYNLSILLKVHYNNTKTMSEKIGDMRIHVVKNLRKHDAGIMELGLDNTDKMAIPPRQVGFPLSGYCIAECTNNSIPVNITIFGSHLHTHSRGVRVMTRHIRGDTELPEINRDDYYSYNFQQIRQLRQKPVVLPGDALITTCYYNTLSNENATLVGITENDEMCVNYIQYYPAINLTSCKSAVSEKSLTDFFESKMKDPNKARSENYLSLKWDPPLVKQLYRMYVDEPLSMSCNHSPGYQFPGYNWENAAITSASILPPEHEHLEGLEMGDCDFLGECIY